MLTPSKYIVVASLRSLYWGRKYRGPKEGCNFFWNTTFFLLPKSHGDNYTIGKLDPRGKFEGTGIGEG